MGKKIQNGIYIPESNWEYLMSSANQIVEEILNEYLGDLSKIDGIECDFHKALSAILKDEKKITALKLEHLIYGEANSI